MTYQEKKTETGWEYKCIDIFGTIDIKSPTQLSVSLLDDMVLLLLRQNHNAQVLNGSVQHNGGTVEYTFTKESQWSEVSEDEEKEWDDTPCEIDTSTSINETVSVFTLIRRYVGNIWSKLRKSVTALRRIWKNPQ